MSVQTPQKLLNLAGTSLLREEALAISVLEDLPTELFPPLFMEAFDGRHIETLKAMVQVWPFVRLPLGGLIDMPYMGPLQAVLEGIDLLLAQKVRPRCKLRVLDLRDTGQSFWNMWSGSSTQVSPDSQMAPVAVDRSRTKRSLAPLKVLIDLSLKRRTLDPFLTYLSRWVERRKDSILLCCRKLSISAMPMENIMKVLAQVQLDCIQEVQVNCTWKLSTLATFAPLLGQMTNVQKLLLSLIFMSALEEHEQQHVVQILSQFLRLHHLRDLHLECVCDHNKCELMAWFVPRCLDHPLDNLSITYTLLTESDMTHLSQSSNIRQLKGLDLSGVMLAKFSPELLQVLLEKVAATLQELDLDLCGITDSQFEAILPALCHCSQLRYFSLRGNFLSMANMEKILRHVARLPNLSHEWYPAPQESYSPQGVPLEGRLKEIQAEVLEILKDLGRTRTIRISPSPCPHYGDDICDHLEPIVYCPDTHA
uniref:Uncharacterized protein n=1 Tax=Sus scrofa TaxID=9823 RepID=A0A8D1YF87_PIG